nr:MAG TPA: hypothetical protein [Caudoviricetes sp.]
MRDIESNDIKECEIIERYKKEIVIMVKKIHKEKFIRMIYGFVKRLYEIQEEKEQV